MDEETLNKWKEIRELLRVIDGKFDDFATHMGNFAKEMEKFRH